MTQSFTPAKLSEEYMDLRRTAERVNDREAICGKQMSSTATAEKAFLQGRESAVPQTPGVNKL